MEFDRKAPIALNAQDESSYYTSYEIAARIMNAANWVNIDDTDFVDVEIIEHETPESLYLKRDITNEILSGLSYESQMLVKTILSIPEEAAKLSITTLKYAIMNIMPPELGWGPSKVQNIIDEIKMKLKRMARERAQRN